MKNWPSRLVFAFERDFFFFFRFDFFYSLSFLHLCNVIRIEN